MTALLLIAGLALLVVGWNVRLTTAPWRIRFPQYPASAGEALLPLRPGAVDPFFVQGPGTQRLVLGVAAQKLRV